ncbi:type I-E CRISPR-associated protein Cas5/CasD [Fibrella sp. HMF5335]|uniref:Type I-E CRISPR-associated protein Cas5/CasD n=2 Tax=Fibrella rubiginis TaxID=2817060 RepID=A0A939K6U7_9BACT|nr:type I-E CRISPR-associated protein Cas5/CasD [Fibrella rubiginis]
MRLAGPMQSWGVSSRFSIRETLTEPSKSGVVGLLCAALGWDRAAPTHPIAGSERPLATLANLPMAVRVLREGTIRRDYHTAQNVLRAKAKLRPGKPTAAGDLQGTVLSERFYLSDAHFLVGLESDDLPFLEALDAALAAPFWPLSLGRKAFAPTAPVRFANTLPDLTTTSIAALPMMEALLTAIDPFFMSRRRETENPMLRLVADSGVYPALALGYVGTSRAQRTDVPLSFASRQFAPREVTIFTPKLNDAPI